MSAYDAVVIGAGQAGLLTSYHLQKSGFSHVVLERGKPGNSWGTQRWDSFRLNTINQITTLPGMEIGPHGPDGFESAQTFIEQLSDFASKNSLPVRTGADVEWVTRASDGNGFVVQIAGDADAITCSVVVCASGSQNFPRIPVLANHLPDSITSMHASDYRNPDQLPPGAVMVVGSAQTGVQVTEDLLAAGRQVYLSTSKVGRVPRRYRGQDTSYWFVESGFFSHRPSDLADPNEMKMVQPQVSGTRGGHTVSLQGLATRGVKLLGRFEMVEDGIAQFRDNLRENIEFGDKVSTMIKTRLDGMLTAKGIELLEDTPDPEDQVDESAYELENPSELDLAAEGITSVIWSTGFLGDFSYLDVDGAVQQDGRPAHTDGVSPADGVYFIGMPWLRTRGSGIVYGVNDDAEAITAHIAQRLNG